MKNEELRGRERRLAAFFTLNSSLFTIEPLPRPTPFLFVRLNLVGRGVGYFLVLGHFEVAAVVFHGIVQRGVFLENIRHGDLFKNRLPGTLRFARAAVDTFVGMDVELV